MSNAKFTPGPWSAKHRVCADGMYRTQVFDGRGLEIAELAWTPRQVSPAVIATDREANASLIAAAPDLLAACVEFVRKCDSGQARSEKSYAQMKAAIQAATGEQA